MAKAIFGGALFLGGCIAGFAFLMFDRLEDVYQVILANFSISCILLGLILGVAGMLQERKNNKNNFLK